MKKVRIDYGLTAASGILVGSTGEVLKIGLDKSTIRRRRVDGMGRWAQSLQPVVPGSSMKGKVRNEVERILANYRDLCHAPRAETMCPHDPGVKNPPCAVCRIFGSPALQSSLIFSDATTTDDPTLGPYLTRTQAGVSLSRKRRTAEDERLYYIERGNEDLRYTGRVDGYLDDEATGRQLAVVLAALESLVAVGGSKSRGAGWTRARVLRLTIDGAEVTTDEIAKLREKGLKEWLESR